MRNAAESSNAARRMTAMPNRVPLERFVAAIAARKIFGAFPQNGWAVL
jgi:hypothetical protein